MEGPLEEASLGNHRRRQQADYKTASWHESGTDRPKWHELVRSLAASPVPQEATDLIGTEGIETLAAYLAITLMRGSDPRRRWSAEAEAGGKGQGNCGGASSTCRW
jgi:hypothetical protein